MSPGIRACIFDVDGLLINSEDIYTEIYNKVLSQHGKPDYPWSVKAMQQSRGRDGTQRILSWASLSLTVEEWNAQVKQHRNLFSKCVALPGVAQLLETLSNKVEHVPELAIASSSNDEVFAIKTAKLPEITRNIAPERRVFGNDPEMLGKSKKPSPDIFVIALQRINKLIERNDNDRKSLILPEECLVFEDSIAGVEAARRAGMRVIWIPHAGLKNVCQGHGDAVLDGKVPIDLPELRPASTREINQFISADGRAEMLQSLEDFPYEKYGFNIRHSL